MNDEAYSRSERACWKAIKHLIHAGRYDEVDKVSDLMRQAQRANENRKNSSEDRETTAIPPRFLDRLKPTIDD